MATIDDLMRAGAIEGPPTFAIEFHHEMDEARLADYFEAGTLVVWEVWFREQEVHKWLPGLRQPAVFTPGVEADAEPAVPGWWMAVDDVFSDDF